MKLQQSHKQSLAGSAVLMVVVVTALAAIVMVAYMSLVSRQNYSTVRSQAWNATIPVIEAGIEDAMAHLNEHGSTNLACDGWQQIGDIYAIKRTIAESYYVVTISNYFVGMTNNNPVVESRGFVPMPVQIASGGHYMFAAAGGLPGQGNLGRGIRATTGSSALFAKGLVAKGQIDLAGNNIATDSFDSTDPLASTGGKYDPYKRKANGDVATNSGLTNSVNVGNADILGRVSTGPGGSVAIGPSGSIGDLAWGGKPGIKPGYLKDDMNVDFPDPEVPFTGGAFPLDPGTVGGTNYSYVAGDGNYQVNGPLVLRNSEKMLVRGTNTVLYVTGDFDLSGQASIILAPGASLKLYVGGASGNIGGNGVMNPGSALNFSYIGLTNQVNLSLSGNAAFTGTIYAPNASFTLNGGGSTRYDFVGASITKTARMNGHFNFHYDEALSKHGPKRGYVVTSWNEMTPAEVAAFTLE